MNQYLCYDDKGRAFVGSAFSVDDVINEIEATFLTHVSCWFIVDGSFALPRRIEWL